MIENIEILTKELKIKFSDLKIIKILNCILHNYFLTSYLKLNNQDIDQSLKEVKKITKNNIINDWT